MNSLFTTTLFEASDANASEVAAYKKLLAKGFTSFAGPSGSDTAFPDFGLTINIDGKQVDLHIEYKMTKNDQMGSVRDWKFDGSKFTSPDSESVNKAELLELMNGDAGCVARGKALLSSFKQHFDQRVSEISSGMLNFISDKGERKEKLIAWTKSVDNYSLANIKSPTLGDKIINHYTSKFKPRAGADYSILMMMMGSEMWVIQADKKIPPELQRKISEALGVDDIPVLNNINAKLEVRIQPRGLHSDGRVAIDVMASFRMDAKSAPAGAGM